MKEFKFKIPEYQDKELIAEVNYYAQLLGFDTTNSVWTHQLECWIKDNPVSFQHIRNGELTDHLLSYHNWKHMAHMISVTQQLAIYYDLPIIDRIVLFWAAFYHDYSHSFGKEKDFTNIAIAIDRFKKSWMGDTCIIMPFVIRLIEVTEFPFVHEPRTLLEKIIRDADLTMSLSRRADLFAIGLNNELKLPDGSITVDTMYEFAKSNELYTDEIKNLFRGE